MEHRKYVHFSFNNDYTHMHSKLALYLYFYALLYQKKVGHKTTTRKLAQFLSLFYLLGLVLIKMIVMMNMKMHLVLQHFFMLLLLLLPLLYADDAMGLCR